MWLKTIANQIAVARHVFQRLEASKLVTETPLDASPCGILLALVWALHNNMVVLDEDLRHHRGYYTNCRISRYHVVYDAERQRVTGLHGNSLYYITKSLQHSNRFRDRHMTLLGGIALNFRGVIDLQSNID